MFLVPKSLAMYLMIFSITPFNIFHYFYFPSCDSFLVMTSIACRDIFISKRNIRTPYVSYIAEIKK